jgi:hypothetical protein
MATTVVSGKAAWEWILAHSGRHGSLVVTDGLTVGALETACGKGALTAARRYCERRGAKAEFGPAYPYAAFSRSVEEYVLTRSWSEEKRREYIAYWQTSYGGALAEGVRAPGQEQAGDRIAMRYPVVG